MQVQPDGANYRHATYMAGFFPSYDAIGGFEVTNHNMCPDTVLEDANGFPPVEGVEKYVQDPVSMDFV